SRHGVLLAQRYIRRVPRQIRVPRPLLLAAPLVLALVAYCMVSFRVAESVTRVDRLPLEPPATSVAGTHEDVSFESRDGTLLKGWWFAVAGADRAAVLVHGRGRNRINSTFRPDRIARMLLSHGYSLLLFDLRGHGESGGTRYTLGIEEPRDVLAAIDLAAQKTRVDRARVAVNGESPGGGSAPLTGKENPSIRPVGTESALRDGKPALRVTAFLARELGPEKPVARAAGILAALRRGG